MNRAKERKIALAMFVLAIPLLLFPLVAMAQQEGIAETEQQNEGSSTDIVSLKVARDSAYDISRATITVDGDAEFNPLDCDFDDDERVSLYLDSVYGFTVKLDGKELDEYDDFDYTAVANRKTGWGTLTVTGTGDYYGTKTASFKAVAYLDNSDVRCYNKKETVYEYDDDDEYGDYETDIVYSVKNRIYTGKEIKPKLTVEFYETDSNEFTWYDDEGYEHSEYETYDSKVITLKEGIDYKLSYKNNVSLGKATISVIGIGLFKGTIKKTFRITYPISKAKISKIKKKIYKGKAIKPKPTVKCLGKTLKRGTDYTLSYKDNKQGGEAIVVIKGKGKYTGSLKKAFKIYVPMKRVRVEKIPAQCLYSKAATPDPTVRVGSTVLWRGYDYSLKYKNNKKAGTATVIIKGKGYYKGTKKATFKIIPKGTGSTITKAEFNKIEIGMSYKKVKYLIGSGGSLINEWTYEDYEDDSYYDEDLEEWVDDYYTTTVYCETYQWKGNRSYSGAQISFEDGCVESKNQWGL